jgi:protein SCO1/2
MRLPLASLALFAAFIALTTPALAGESERVPRELQGVDVIEHLGSKVDLDLTFVGEDGYPKPLRTYFQKGRPVILNLVYYNCPMLCNLVLNGQTAAMREMGWTPGKEYEVVTISIDPFEDYGMARSKKATYMASFEREAPGWHFLIDHQGNVAKLAQQVGFQYRRDDQTGQYAHASVIFVLSPEGKISRYLYGVKFRAFDVKLALSEAAEGKTGLTQKLLLLCFHYDPASRSYAPYAMNIMRGGGVLMVLIMGTVLYRLFRRERDRNRLSGAAANTVTV